MSHRDPHCIEIKVANADATFGTIFRNPIAAIFLFIKETKLVDAIHLDDAAKFKFA